MKMIDLADSLMGSHSFLVELSKIACACQLRNSELLPQISHPLNYQAAQTMRDKYYRTVLSQLASQIPWDAEVAYRTVQSVPDQISEKVIGVVDDASVGDIVETVCIVAK